MDAVKSLHEIGFLHRDIKPSNFCLRWGNPTEICLLDFGLVRQYVNGGPDGHLRSPRSSAGFRGTVRYASVNAHKYQELGRHDDLWSMYYMLVEMVSGQLPWHRNNQKDAVRDMKLKENNFNLGLVGGLPQSIAMYWSTHLSSLNYYATPNYFELRKVIDDWIVARNISWEEPYDWQLSIPAGITRIESATVLSSAQQMRRSGAQPGIGGMAARQFIPNAKRSTAGHYESTGVMRRLDKRAYGSSSDLKRAGSEGDLAAAVAGRSTAAIADDALTNQNKTQVPGCVTMASENQLMEKDDWRSGNADADEGSAKVDGKDKLMMGSYLDLVAIGGSGDGGADSNDRQFRDTANPPAGKSITGD